MTRLLVASTLAGVVLSVALAWSFRADVARAAEPPAAARESTAEQLEAVARGCASAGLDVTFGSEDGVAILRCRQALPNLGMGPAVARRVAR